MSFRMMTKKVKEFIRLAVEHGLWKKVTKLNVDPEVVDVRVRETRGGYEINVSMKVSLQVWLEVDNKKALFTASKIITELCDDLDSKKECFGVVEYLKEALINIHCAMIRLNEETTMFDENAEYEAYREQKMWEEEQRMLEYERRMIEADAYDDYDDYIDARAYDDEIARYDVDYW